MRSAEYWSVVLVGLALLGVQDSRQQGATQPQAHRPQAPPGSEPLPPVQEPFRTPVERRDLIQRFTAPSPLEGFYELRRVVRPGLLEPAKAKGYLVIGRQHLALQLQIATGSPDIPFLQSGVRRYTATQNALRTTSLVGMCNKPNGDVLIDQEGLSEVRRFLLAGTTLQIWQDDGSYMEFVRIE